MKLSRIFKYKKPKTLGTNLLLFLSIEKSQYGFFLVKQYVNKHDYYLFINGKKVAIPPVREVKQSLTVNQFKRLQSFLSFNKSLDSLSETNTFLSKRPITRTNIGFRFVEPDEINFDELNNKSFNPSLSLPTILDNDNLKFRVFNVGQANCSCLLNSNNTVFFDMGCMKINKSLVDTINNTQKAVLIISHFDYDHINFARRLLIKKQKEIICIYPAIEDDEYLTFAAKMVLIAFSLCGFEMVPLRLEDSKCVKMGIVNLFQGTTKVDENQSTIMNARCLIALIKSNDHQLLIPGDSLYKNFPIKFEPDYLIIPHHGCKYSTKKDMCLDNITENKVTDSFVFCGPCLKYKHPNVLHLKHFYSDDRSRKIYRFSKNKHKYKGSEIFNDDSFIKHSEDFTKLLHGEHYDFMFSDRKR